MRVERKFPAPKINRNTTDNNADIDDDAAAAAWFDSNCITGRRKTFISLHFSHALASFWLGIDRYSYRRKTGTRRNRYHIHMTHVPETGARSIESNYVFWTMCHGLNVRSQTFVKKAVTTVLKLARSLAALISIILYVYNIVQELATSTHSVPFNRWYQPLAD